jgi:hypothetical protein
MGPLRALIALLAALVSAGAVAQPVTSPAPDKVAVTIYRAPAWAGQAFDLRWLRGYALVTETRTVTIPAGRATIRFEGVAGGILPESAIVTGLPDGVREKNLDADLLSPRSLYASQLGRPVTLRRTVEGRVIDEPAVIRSGPDGAAILETKDGFIAANCGPDQERILFGPVPAGLSAKPTLSVETESTAARTVTLTLSYLAWGFDWQANYVATMRPDGRSAELFAWVTLANGDVTGFADAETMVVAGQVQRNGSPNEVRGRYISRPFSFRCFARYVTEHFGESRPRVARDGDEIVVTAMRAGLANAAPAPSVAMAEREALGDLNLYRIPHRTTLAAKSQKQVGLIDRPSVELDVIYRSTIWAEGAPPPRIVLRTRNRRDKGLGLPLPGGKVAVFEPRGDSRVLVGEGVIGDKAIDEEIEVPVAQASAVSITLDPELSPKPGETRDYRVTVHNSLPRPIRYEADFTLGSGYVLSKPSARLGRKNGRDLWAVRVPANGTATLRYRVTRQ